MAKRSAFRLVGFRLLEVPRQRERDIGRVAGTKRGSACSSSSAVRTLLEEVQDG